MNYQNAKIYKIVSDSSDLVYYGSTCSPLSRRMSGHRATYKHWLQGPDKANFTTSYRLLELGDAQIFLVELFSCNTGEELRARERYYIENNECVNRRIPGRSKSEYKKIYDENNKEAIIAQTKEYRQINREQINAKKKENFDCKCGNSYTRTHKAQHERTLNHRKYLANLRNDSDSDDLSNEIEQLNNLVIY